MNGGRGEDTDGPAFWVDLGHAYQDFIGLERFDFLDRWFRFLPDWGKGIKTGVAGFAEGGFPVPQGDIICGQLIVLNDQWPGIAVDFQTIPKCGKGEGFAVGDSSGKKVFQKKQLGPFVQVDAGMLGIGGIPLEDQGLGIVLQETA